MVVEIVWYTVFFPRCRELVGSSISLQNDALFICELAWGASLGGDCGYLYPNIHFLFIINKTQIPFILTIYLIFDIKWLFMSIEAEGGRVYIPKDLREKYGEKYQLIDAHGKLVLLPVPDNPLQALRDQWSDVDKSIDELKQEALDEAQRQAGK